MKDIVIKSIVKATKLNKEQVEKLLEVPPNPELGDYAFPCFTLSKKFKKSPVEIAQDLIKKIPLEKNFEKIEDKGPYLNFFLNRKELAKSILTEVQKKKDKFGSSKSKSKILIEFSQPNTHKAFHVGHIRGTSLGESLARILEFSGNKVIRANYSGDTGMHIAKWIWCYKKYHSKEKITDNESWIASIYVDAVKKLTKNEKFQEEVDEINRKIESKEDPEINELWKKTRELSINSWERIYSELNTKFDVQFFESEMEKEGKNISQQLLKDKIAEKSEGAVIVNLEKYNLGIWVLLRNDGTVLYSAKDLALAKIKVEKYNSDRYITILGDEQKMHSQQILKTMELMKFKERNKFIYPTFGMVRLPTGKMSSRTGDNILYSDFMKEVTEFAKAGIKSRDSKIKNKDLEERALKISVAAIKYAMLKQSVNKNMIFDKKEALNFEGDTGPYLLYTYARARSILRKAKFNPKKKYNLLNLSDKEKNLIVQMGKFSEIVKQAYSHLAPNLVANYAYELAQSFNEFYHSTQVIGDDREQFLLVLVSSFSQVLKNALNLLGIEVLEKM